MSRFFSLSPESEQNWFVFRNFALVYDIENFWKMIKKFLVQVKNGPLWTTKFVTLNFDQAQSVWSASCGC